ncbi:MAG: glycerate kinase [bacterium]
MRVLIAPDSFKGSLPAIEIGERIAGGVRSVFPQAETIIIPLADGGEGTVEALVSATGGQIMTQSVTGPLGEKVEAKWGLLGDGITAVLEMAAASGLPLVPEERRNPMVTTTYGTGELIRGGLDQGCRRFIIGIGGSATNDGGAGMAQALGVKLLDVKGEQISYGAAGLGHLKKIDIKGLDPRLKGAEVLVACDVNNPLTGPAGAAQVFGPQKGANPEMVGELDRLLERFAKVVERDLGRNVKDIPGAGAAGGLGAGLLAFLAARLVPGVDLILEVVGLEEILREGVDLVITGEGEINRQTLYGKVPVGVARLAKKYNVAVIAIVGSIGQGAEDVYQEGIEAMMTIVNGPISLAEAMAKTGDLVAEATARVMRLVKVGMDL